MNRYLDLIWTATWIFCVVYFCLLGALDFTFSRITCDYGYNSTSNYFNYTSDSPSVFRASYKEIGYRYGNTTGIGDNFIIISSNEYINNCSFRLRK